MLSDARCGVNLLCGASCHPERNRRSSPITLRITQIIQCDHRSEISHYEVSRKLAAQGVIRFAVSGERHIGFDLHVNLLGDCVQTPALRRNALES
jgi:hypothetical protein